MHYNNCLNPDIFIATPKAIIWFNEKRVEIWNNNNSHIKDVRIIGNKLISKWLFTQQTN